MKWASCGSRSAGEVSRRRVVSLMQFDEPSHPVALITAVSHKLYYDREGAVNSVAESN